MEYRNSFKEEFPNNPKKKVQLFTEIKKCRENLSINTEMEIKLENFHGEEDFIFILTREKFEGIVYKLINLFSKELNDFYKDLINKSLHIDGIEMIGGLVRTPVIEKCIIQVCGNNLSKTNLVDECMAIGAALFNSYSNSMKNGVKFPLGQFQYIYGYNSYDILYKYNLEKGEIKKGMQLPIAINTKDSNNTTPYSKYLTSNNHNMISFFEMKNNNQVKVIEYFLSIKDFDCYIDNSGYIRLDTLDKKLRQVSGVLLNEKDQYFEIIKIEKFLYDINRIDQIEGEIQQEKNSLTTKFYENKRLIKNNSLENIRVNSSTENLFVGEEVKNIEKDFRSLNKIVNKDAAKQELIKIKNKMARLGKSVDKAIKKKQLYNSDIYSQNNINYNINTLKFINIDGKDDNKNDSIEIYNIDSNYKPQIKKNENKNDINKNISKNNTNAIRRGKNEEINNFKNSNNNNNYGKGRTSNIHTQKPFK